MSSVLAVPTKRSAKQFARGQRGGIFSPKLRGHDRAGFSGQPRLAEPRHAQDGHLDLALIHTEKYPWGIHHFGFKVDSVKEIENIADTKAEDNTYGAIAESWIKDVEGNRVDVSEHGWPI